MSTFFHLGNLKHLFLFFLFIIFFHPIATSHAIVIFSNESFQNDANKLTIDADGNATSTITLEFGALQNETLVWNINTSQFELSNNLEVQGNLSSTGNKAVLDSDDSGGDISLQFGNTLGKTLEWNTAEGTFTLNDGLHLGGDLNLDGTQITLDKDNAASGNTVEIIAHQGNEPDGILRYNTTTNQWEISNNGGAFQSIANTISSSLIALQARRTSTFSLTTSFSDIPLDTVDISTDTTILERNTTNTAHIDIKEHGLYMIYYNAIAGGSAGSTHLTTARLQKNGTTILPASTTVNRNYQNEYSANTTTILAELNAGDYITLQLQRDSTADTTQGDITLNIIKMEGIQGPQGPAGAPGSAGSGTDGTSFTLDQDNSGVGNTVTLIANQGSDTAGILQYNSTTNQWEISNNGEAFEPIATSMPILQVYQSGTTTFNANTAITWNGTNTSLRFVDANFTHSTSSNPSRITVNSNGLYRIRYTINWDTSTNTWRTATCTLFINGSSPNPPVGTTNAFSRNNTDDTATNTTTVLYNLSAADYIEVYCASTGTSGSITTIANESSLSMQKLR